MEKTLIRWLLMVAVFLFIYVIGSKYISYVPNGRFQITEIPELDFTLTNLISASIGLSALAADTIQQAKAKVKQHINIMFDAFLCT